MGIKTGKESPNYINRVGEEHLTNEGYLIEIIDSYGAHKHTIRFKDEKGTVMVRTYQNIINKNIKNPYHPSVFGIGYFGVGKYKAKENYKKTKTYNTWQSMLERCYCPKAQKKQPTYVGCLVDERWRNFQVFAEWYEKNYNSETMQGWALDKDILIKGNKIYSPETCCVVPMIINAIYTKNSKARGDYPVGVSKKGEGFLASTRDKNDRKITKCCKSINEAFTLHKISKEIHVKKVAQDWKPLINPRVYEALINYQVEITD
jgi:hypothetical protein